MGERGDDMNLIPKHHYMVHLPKQTLEYGPARNLWCMRFEGLNAWMKQYVLRGRNFKNVPKTIATRHQEGMCLNLNSNMYLQKSIKFPKSSALINDDDLRLRVINFLGLRVGVVNYVVSITKVAQLPLPFTSGTIFQLDQDLDYEPIFARLERIVLIGEFTLFEVQKLQPVNFQVEYFSYEVERQGRLHLVNAARWYFEGRKFFGVSQKNPSIYGAI